MSRPAPSITAAALAGTLASLLTAAELSAPGGKPHSPADARLVIDVNAASAAELAMLPMIGPARAQSIVDARAAGPLRTLDDLAAIPGIGPSAIREIAPHVRFDAAAAKADDPRSSVSP